MPTKRRSRRRVRRRSRRTALKVLATLQRHRTLLVAVVGALVAWAGVVELSRYFSVSCPEEADCVTLRELRAGAPLPEALRIYDRQGELLAEVAGPLRRALPQDEMPELLADAFVAIEDRRFWSHDGVDARGVLRAAVVNVREGGISEGASTIPMQLVRTLWGESLRDVGPWRRKVIEARTAPRLVDELGHERVLNLYLNAIYLGNGIYGVERAARHYFGTGVEGLTLGQVATLVGMTRSPEYYEPRRHPERATLVRDVVLAELADEGLISEDVAAEAMEDDLGVVSLDGERGATLERTHLTASVTRELRRVAPTLSGRPGLALHTTIDAEIQRQGEEALREQIASIESGRYGAFEGDMGTDAAEHLEGAAVALDPTTSAIRAWVGGRDFDRSQFDRVDQSRRQVGSLVKPFLVALALERGMGIVDMVSADTIPISTETGAWLPADHVWETSLPMREALVRSSNRAAAHLGTALGLDAVATVGHRVGLSGPIPAMPSSTIGAFEASLLEMTRAFAVFGNEGRLAEAHLLTRIEAPDGEVLWERVEAESEPVLDPGVAYVVLDAMRDVVDRGTGRSVRGFGYTGPASGKTGTSNDGRDAWFVGLTPDLVAGVWIGFDTPSPIVDDRGGGALAAPVWAMWMRGLRGEIPQTRAWIPPANVERVVYDETTGEVASPLCGSVPGVTYRDAWVISGRYDRTGCRDGGVRGWLGRLWRVVAPGDPGPVRPVGPRRPGGG